MNSLFRIPLVSASLMVLGALVACDRKGGQSSNDALYSGKITIGTETWPGYMPLYVAEDQGFFKEEGLDVTIKRYIGLGELSKDYLAGKMQGRANLTLDAVNEALEGLSHRVVLAIDYSAGADAIVARKGIDTVSDFKGKKVAYEPGTLEEFFVGWALLQNEMSLSDIVPVHANPEESAQLLKAGQVDVGVSHEPFLSQSIQSGTAHAVYTSKDAPGLITDILTFRADFVEAHPGTIQAILRAYFKALVFWKAHPAEAYAVMAKKFGDTPTGIARQFNEITMLSLRDNRTAFTFAVGLQSLYGNMRQTGKFVLEHNKRGNRDLDTDKLIDKRFIRDLAKEVSAL
jgi:NitT/TauT family transport system substrate-binding protein